MYTTYTQTVDASQRWLALAVAYQTRAKKLSMKYDKPSLYPDSVFACYRGYARSMQMHDACWAHVDAIDAAYVRRRWHKV